MMIYDKMKQDRMTAMKAKNKFTKTVLTTFIGDIESDVKRGATADDDYIIPKLKKTIQSLDENYALTRDEKFKQEKVILEFYLPKMASDEEVKAKIEEIVSSNINPNIGLIMKELKQEYGSLLDGKKASAMAKEMLG